MTLLQLALDVVDLRHALEIARECAEYADIIEAGTPLIKREGIGIVSQLRELGKPICADLKTFDAGALEADMAVKEGASFATVLAVASDRTILDFVRTCHEGGVKVLADMMKSPIERATTLEGMKVDYITVHSGVDQQKEGIRPFGELLRLKERVKTPLAVAGGLGSEHMARVAGTAEIIIVGNAITGAKSPKVAAKRIKETLERAGRD